MLAGFAIGVLVMLVVGLCLVNHEAEKTIKTLRQMLDAAQAQRPRVPDAFEVRH